MRAALVALFLFAIAPACEQPPHKREVFGLPEGVSVMCELGQYNEARKCVGTDSIVYTCIDDRTGCHSSTRTCGRLVP